MKRAPPEDHEPEPPLFAWKHPNPTLPPITGGKPIRFDGSTIDPAQDNARLSKQLDAVRAYMLTGEWRTLQEIAHAVGAPEASVSARLRDLRKPKFGGWKVEHDRVSGGTWRYRVLP